MTIGELNIRDFRGIGELSTSLSERVEARGRNGAGKSSLLDAICFLLLGCSASGSDKADVLIRQEARAATVEGQVQTRKGSFYVRRTRTTRGSTLHVESGRDATEMSQAEFEERILGLSLPPMYKGDRRHLLLAATAPGYFLGLEPKEQREMLVSLLPKPDQADVLAQLDDPEPLEGLAIGDAEYLLAQVRQTAKDTLQQQAMLAGSLEQAEKALVTPLPPAPPKQPPISQAEIDTLAQQEEQALQLRDRAAKLMQHVKVLQGEGKALVASKRLLPDKPDTATGLCPLCGQVIGQQEAEHVLAEWQKQRDEIAAANAKLDAQIAAKRSEYVQAVKAAKAAVAQAKAQPVEQLQQQLRQAQAALAAWEKQQALYEQSRAAFQKAQQEQAELKQQLETVTQQLHTAQEQEKALRRYRVVEAGLASQRLAQLLRHVSVELFSLVKSTGEMKPDFRLMYDGRPLLICSYSEQIRASIEIAMALRALAGINLPLLVDNAEAIIGDPVPEEIEQAVLARVADQPLEIVPINQQTEQPAQAEQLALAE